MFSKKTLDYSKWNHYAGINPPWGALYAIDLNTRKIAWKSVLEEFPELSAQGIPITGREN